MKFKVGDWVKAKYLNRPVKILKINYFDECLSTFEFTENSPQVDPISAYASECELWQPQEGEWCWFWNEGASKPTIGRYESKLTKTTFNMKDSIYYYDNCEPFIGELPSFIKDNNDNRQNRRNTKTNILP